MLRERLFYDLTPNGVINERLVVSLFSFANQSKLSAEQKRRFFNALLLQAKKLLALWIHYDRFRNEVERLKPIAPTVEKSEAPKHFSIRYSQELYLEFDEFLVQYKSSLD